MRCAPGIRVYNNHWIWWDVPLPTHTDKILCNVNKITSLNFHIIEVLLWRIVAFCKGVFYLSWWLRMQLFNEQLPTVKQNRETGQLTKGRQWTNVQTTQKHLDSTGVWGLYKSEGWVSCVTIKASLCRSVYPEMSQVQRTVVNMWWWKMYNIDKY